MRELLVWFDCVFDLFIYEPLFIVEISDVMAVCVCVCVTYFWNGSNWRWSDAFCSPTSSFDPAVNFRCHGHMFHRPKYLAYIESFILITSKTSITVLPETALKANQGIITKPLKAKLQKINRTNGRKRWKKKLLTQITIEIWQRIKSELGGKLFNIDTVRKGWVRFMNWCDELYADEFHF